MRDKLFSRKTTLGTGYATVIMIFVLIILSLFALLSYNAAQMNETLEKNNKEYITSFYNAQNRFSKNLADTDAAAVSGHESGFFDESFEFSLDESGVRYRRTSEGFMVNFSEPVNDRIRLSADVIFYYEPSAHDGKRFNIEEFKTISTSGAEEESLGVWDGSSPLGRME